MIRKMNRRTILKTAASALILPKVSPLMGARPARAQQAPVAWAIYTNSDGWFNNLGPVKGMPATATNVLISYYWNTTTLPNGFGCPISIGPSGNNFTQGTLQVTHESNPYPGGPMYLSVLVQSNVNGQNQSTLKLAYEAANNSGTTLPTDGRWHNILMFIDTANLRIDALLDLNPLQGYASLPFGGNNGAGGPFAIPLSGGQSISIAATNQYNGADPIGHMDNTGLAEFYVAAGYQVNIFDPNVQAGFVDIESGYATRNASNGQSAIPGVTPQIYLSGPSNLFPRNLAASAFAWPLQVTDDAASSFTVMGSSLQTAGSDPFEPGSPV